MFERGFKTWCENTAAQRRRDLGIPGAGRLDPAILAASLGIDVRSIDEIPGLDAETRETLYSDSSGWSAVTITNGVKHVIILNASHSGGRVSSDLMHELSHVIIGHKPGRVDITEDGSLILNTYAKAQEDEANWLAGCLLLPREALLGAVRSGIEAERIADLYGASTAMVEYRMNVTGVGLQLRRRRAATQNKVRR